MAKKKCGRAPETKTGPRDRSLPFNSLADAWPERVTPVKGAAPKPPTRPEPPPAPRKPVACPPARTAPEGALAVPPPAARPGGPAAQPPGAGSPTVPLGAGPGHDRFRQIIERRGAGGGGSIDVYLGIDLGTSFTKVVWRGSRTARPVRFGGRGNVLEDYLVPSVVAFDGSVLVDGTSPQRLRKAGDECRVSNFKMCLACVSSGSDACRPDACGLADWRCVLSCEALGRGGVGFVTTVFLARVISRARAAVVSHLISEGVKEPAVRWSANLAVPEKFMDQSPVLSGFERVFKVSWLMADVFDEVGDVEDVDTLLRCFGAAAEAAEGREADCFVYPEVGAEVACVTMSRAARDGLYAFVDVGAGTVDASVFRLGSTPDGDSALHTYAADVSKTGAAHVETAASRRLTPVSVGWFKGMKERQSGADLRNCSAEELLEPLLREACDEVSRTLNSELVSVLKEAYGKEPNTDRWSGLNLIIGGGGARVPFYREVATKVFRGHGLAPGLTDQPLSIPDDFDMGPLPPSEFHRFAVAYGLSHRYVDLQQVALPGEVAPLPPHMQRRRARARVAPSHDDE